VYNSEIGRFLSRDPIDERGGLNLYAACGNDMVNRVDPLGLSYNGNPQSVPIPVPAPSIPSDPSPTSGSSTPRLSHITVDGPTARNCGNFTWTIQWLLNAPSKTGGYIIQHVVPTANLTFCTGATVNLAPIYTQEYWEAWRVDPGDTITTYAVEGNTSDDTFQNPTFSCTHGTFAIIGVAYFYEGATLPPSFQIGTGPAGGVPMTTQNPHMSGGSNQSNPDLHTVTTSWNCCSGNDTTTQIKIDSLTQ
jgi:hypothetical protein